MSTPQKMLSTQVNTPAQDVSVQSTSDVPDVFVPVHPDDPVISALLGITMGSSSSAANAVEPRSTLTAPFTAEQAVSSSPRRSGATSITTPVASVSRTSTPWNPATRVGLERMRQWVCQHVPLGRRGRMLHIVREIHHLARTDQVEDNVPLENVVYALRTAMRNPQVEDWHVHLERRWREAAPHLQLARAGAMARSPVNLARAMQAETSTPETPLVASEAQTETDTEGTDSEVEDASHSSNPQDDTDQEDDSSLSVMSIGSSASSSPVPAPLARQETPFVAVMESFWVAERRRLVQYLQRALDAESAARVGFRARCNAVSMEMEQVEQMMLWGHQMQPGELADHMRELLENAEAARRRMEMCSEEVREFRVQLDRAERVVRSENANAGAI